MSIVIRLLCFILAACPMLAQVEAGLLGSKLPPQDPSSIRILVIHNKPGVVLEVKGKYKIYDPKSQEHISTRFVGKRKFIQAVKDGLKWGEEFPGIYQIVIVPDSQSTTTIVDGVEYKGSVYVYDVGGTISVVNELKVDDFISSMLAPQFASSELASEALSAVVIAARTHAYFLTQNPASSFFAADGRKVGYQGYAISHPNSLLEIAIAKTKNMVMSSNDSQPGKVSAFPAIWGSSSAEAEGQNKGVVASISVMQADEMARNGKNAADILQKAFPNMKIKTIH